MNRRKLKESLAYMIGLMPFNSLRCFLYRKWLGYRVFRSRIGWATFIAVDEAELRECSIGGRTRFLGPMRLLIDKGSRIGGGNRFGCGWWTKDERLKTANYARSVHIGENTLISSGHHFDVVGSFVLGRNSWIAGRGSQFWTHGAGAKDRNITIGKGCYIGSAVRFAPGSSVGDNCVVGLGSVVTENIDASNAVIAGHPATIIRENYDWKARKEIGAEADHADVNRVEAC